MLMALYLDDEFERPRNLMLQVEMSGWMMHRVPYLRH